MMIRTPVFFIWALTAFALFAASEVPARRLARQLPAGRAEAATARAAHNAELKQFMRRAGLPDGESLSNVVERTVALRALNAGLTNSAPVQPPPGKHSKDWLLGFSAGAEAARRPGK